MPKLSSKNGMRQEANEKDLTARLKNGSGRPRKAAPHAAQGDLESFFPDPPALAQGEPEKKEGASDCTGAPKFVKVKEKKVKNKKTVEYASKTVVIDEGEGEVPMGPHMTKKTLERIRTCSDWLKLAAPEDYSKFKKTGGFACRNAFCPICAAYQSRRDGLKLNAMMDFMQSLGGMVLADVAKLYGEVAAADPHVRLACEKGVEYVMLTPTSRNVAGERLKAEEGRFAKAFNRLIKDWLAKECPEYLGYARKLEVTYNKTKLITKEMWEGKGKYNKPMKWRFRHMGLKVGDRNPYYDTYNPHYHVLIAVTPDFFFMDEKTGEERMKIPQERFLEKWRQLMGDDTITQFDVRRAYKVRGEGNDATAELSKYVAKDTDMLHSLKVFRTFYEALKGRKRMTHGGLFAVAHKLFKDEKLARFIPADETVYKWEISFAWGGSTYYEKERRELPPDEAARIAGMKYSEAYDTEDF